MASRCLEPMWYPRLLLLVVITSSGKVEDYSHATASDAHRDRHLWGRPTGRGLMGWMWTAGLNGPLGVGAWWLARHGFKRRATIDTTLAAVVLAWTWVTVGLEVLGTLGFMTRGPLLVWSLSLFGLGFWFKSHSTESENPPIQRSSAWSWYVQLALGLVIWAGLAMLVTSILMPVKVVSDGPIYHLYFAARWWKAAKLILVAVPFGENAATYFPAIGDLWFTWLMVGLGSDSLAKVGQAPFLVVVTLAVYGMVRRLGLSSDSALLGSLGILSSAPLLLLSFEPNVDTIFIAAYLTACFFGLELWERPGDVGSLVVAGLAAGLAWGTKATGTVFVPPLIVIFHWLGCRRVSTEQGRSLLARLKSVSILIFAVMLPCGFWFGRNLDLTGNPLYPLQLRFLNRTILTGWYDSDVMKLSQYYLPFEDWRAAVDQFLTVLDPRLAPIWVTSVLVGATLGWRFDRRVAFISMMAILAALLFWGAIPYRTQQRFVFPALGLATVPLAWFLDRARWLQILFSALIIVHVLTSQAWPFGDSLLQPPWDLSPLVPNGIMPLLNLPRTGRWVFGIAGAGSLIVAWLWSQSAAQPNRERVAVTILATIGLVAGMTCLTFATSTVPYSPFPPFRDYFLGWLDLEGRSGPNGLKVAYAGTNIPYYLMGRDFRNEVRYINIDAHRDWLMHDYHLDSAARGQPNWPFPRPGWDRIRPNYEAWLANLRDAGIQVLVVARANPDEGVHNLYDREGFPIERTWAETHPESFSPLYGVVENDRLFKTYRVKPLKP